MIEISVELAFFYVFFVPMVAFLIGGKAMEYAQERGED